MSGKSISGDSVFGASLLTLLRLTLFLMLLKHKKSSVILSCCAQARLSYMHLEKWKQILCC